MDQIVEFMDCLLPFLGVAEGIANMFGLHL